MFVFLGNLWVLNSTKSCRPVVHSAHSVWWESLWVPVHTARRVDPLSLTSSNPIRLWNLWLPTNQESSIALHCTLPYRLISAFDLSLWKRVVQSHHAISTAFQHVYSVHADREGMKEPSQPRTDAFFTTGWLLWPHNGGTCQPQHSTAPVSMSKLFSILELYTPR